MITDDELSLAFERAGGGIDFLRVHHPDRFEAAQPCHGHDTLQNQNKKAKKKAEMKQIIHSDTYAYVAFNSKETFDRLTSGDIALFGICMNVRHLQAFGAFISCFNMSFFLTGISMSLDTSSRLQYFLLGNLDEQADQVLDQYCELNSGS